MKKKIFTAAFFFLSAAAAGAQTSRVEPTPQITVFGLAKTQVKPDRAVVSMGVTVIAATAQEASAKANETLKKIVAGLKSKDIAAEDIQTTQLSLRAERNDGAVKNATPQIVAFTADGFLRVRTRNLADVGALIALAIDNGANQFEDVRFEVSNIDRLIDELNIQALQDGQKRAERYAKSLNLKLGRLLRAEPRSENDFDGVRRVRGYSAAAAPMGAAPVEAGVTELTASFAEVWEVLPQ